MSKLFSDNTLAHYGIPGQKWGQRRWQYEDGRFNEAGKERYFGKTSSDTKFGGLSVSAMLNNPSLEISFQKIAMQERKDALFSKIGKFSKDVSKSYDQFKDYASNQIKDKMEQAGIHSKLIGDTISNGLNNFAYDARKNIGDISYKLNDSISKYKDIAGEGLRSARDMAGRGFDRARDTAGNLASRTGEGLRSARDSINSGLKDARTNFNDFMKSYDNTMDKMIKDASNNVKKGRSNIERFLLDKSFTAITRNYYKKLNSSGIIPTNITNAMYDIKEVPAMLAINAIGSFKNQDSKKRYDRAITKYSRNIDDIFNKWDSDLKKKYNLNK